MKWLVALIFVLTAVGCQSPRIFQDTVKDPVANLVSEDIKQAATYLDKTITTEMSPEADVVAYALSDRVGQPRKELTDSITISKKLKSARNDYNADIKNINKWLDKRQGTELEGTGLNVLGLGGLVMVVGLIVLLVLVPASIPLLIQLVQVIAGTSRAMISSTLKATTSAIEEYKNENPKAAKKLTDKLSVNLDSKEKELIRRAKSGKL